MDIPWKIVWIVGAVIATLVVIGTAVLVYVVPDGVLMIRNWIPAIAGLAGVIGVSMIGYYWWRDRDRSWG